VAFVVKSAAPLTMNPHLPYGYCSQALRADFGLSLTRRANSHLSKGSSMLRRWCVFCKFDSVVVTGGVCCPQTFPAVWPHRRNNCAKL